MPRNKALHDWLADRRRIIHIANAEKTSAWIVRPRLVPGRRQLHERMMLAHSDRFRRRCHVANPPPRLLSRKRERALHFRIQRKIFRLWQINGAPRRIQVISTLLRPPQRRWNSVRIAQEKLRRVHQRVILFFGFHLEAPQRGLSEGIAHGAPFIGIVADRSVFEVFLDEQDLRPAPLKRTIRVAPSCPRSSPMSFEPMPAGSPLWYRNSLLHVSISSHNFPSFASQ